VINPATISRGVRLVLEGLGLNPDQDENLRETPERVSRAYLEMCAGLESLDDKIEAILSKSFPCSNSSMIVAKDVLAHGLCPHHLLPVRYSITLAYIPSAHGRVLGISKLCRLAILLASRPVLQEQLVADVTKALMSIEGCVGTGCIARAEHSCMAIRGVNQAGASIIASSLQGAFFTDPAVRAEFMSLFHNQ
jgi:GTP cyclohydrolase IA